MRNILIELSSRLLLLGFSAFILSVLIMLLFNNQSILIYENNLSILISEIVLLSIITFGSILYSFLKIKEGIKRKQGENNGSY